MSQYLGILTGVFAIAGIAAVAWAGLQRGDKQNLRETNEDLRKSNGDLKTSRDDAVLRAERAEADLAALSRVVTGEAHLTALRDELNEHHAAAEGYWQASTDLGQKIYEALERLSRSDK